MALANKWCGPFTVAYNDITSGTKAFAGLKRDTGVFNITPNTISEDFEGGDGCESNGGFTTEMIITLSDIVAADFDSIISFLGDVVVTFAKSGKVVTFPGTALVPNFQEASLVDGKMQIRTVTRWPLETDFTTMFQIA